MASVTLLLASESDREHGQKILDVLQEFALDADVRIASAHKVPERVLKICEELNQSTKPHVVITCAGRSNGLSGVMAGSCVLPVIACPPFKDKNDYLVNIHSTLQMPSETPVCTVIDPKNAALAAVRILSVSDKDLRKKLQERMHRIKEEYSVPPSTKEEGIPVL